jgi:hypothetical protein
MREKSLSVSRDYRNFRVVLYQKIHLRIRKKIYSAWRSGFKNINVFGEYCMPIAKRILPYMENSNREPVSAIFDQIPEEFGP